MKSCCLCSCQRGWDFRGGIGLVAERSSGEGMAIEALEPGGRDRERAGNAELTFPALVSMQCGGIGGATLPNDLFPVC